MNCQYKSKFQIDKDQFLNTITVDIALELQIVLLKRARIDSSLFLAKTVEFFITI